MRCNTPIMSRAELPSKDAGVRLIGMKKNAAYRQVDRPDKASILCCQQCEPMFQALTPEDENRVETVIATGWVTEMLWAGKSDEFINGFLRRVR